MLAFSDPELEDALGLSPCDFERLGFAEEELELDVFRDSDCCPDLGVGGGGIAFVAEYVEFSACFVALDSRSPATVAELSGTTSVSSFICSCERFLVTAADDIFSEFSVSIKSGELLVGDDEGPRKGSI